MQKDIHYYFTQEYLKRSGFDRKDAEIISIMDQLTDVFYNPMDFVQIMKDLTRIALHHFFHPTDSIICMADSPIIADYIKQAFSSDIFLFGIFLHTYQDSFSHQGFSGYQTDRNSIYKWYNPLSVIPNIGHAEAMTLPDIATETWTDFRFDEEINNSQRVIDMTRGMDMIFSDLLKKNIYNVDFSREFLSYKYYFQRKQFFYNKGIKRFSQVKSEFIKRYKTDIDRSFDTSYNMLRSNYRHLEHLITNSGGEYRREFLKVLGDKKN